MDINSLTIGEAKELQQFFVAKQEGHPFKIGGKYFIRTVTHHLTGRLTKVFATEFVVEDCAWIADDGTFSDAMKNKEFNEVEPYPDGEVIIGRGSLIDMYEIGVTTRSK